MRTGSPFEIRALRPEDRRALLAAVDQSSPESLYRRFVSAKHHFSENEITYFTSIDFVSHVALIAVVKDKELATIIGGGRYVVVEPGRAEIAFAVIDPCQGQGVGAALLRHLIILARAAGLHELVAEVLPGNAPMLRLFKRSGLRTSTTRESDIVHVTMRVSQPGP